MIPFVKSLSILTTLVYLSQQSANKVEKGDPIAMPANTTEIEKKLWATADSLRANSRLKASEYSVPVLGLIFLRFADHRFTQVDQELRKKVPVPGGRYSLSKIDYQAEGVMYLPEEARFSNLLKLPESEDIGKAINDAMKAIEAENEELLGVLPKTYNHLDKDMLVALLIWPAQHR